MLLMVAARAEIVDFPFQSEEQEQRFRHLAGELRCLVCQNQSLADSNAELAQDLRNELYQQVLNDDSNDQIIDFMTRRYGEFILYRPRFNASTFFLWSVPVLLVIIGLLGLFHFARVHARPPPQQSADSELQAIHNLLEQRSGKK